MIEQHDPFAPPDDAEPTVLGPLAERDPNAPDESVEYAVTGAASFDDVLRRARRQGFVAGAAAGGLAGAIVAAVLALSTSRPVPTETATLAPADPSPLEPAAAAMTPMRPRVPAAAAARAALPRAPGRADAPVPSPAAAAPSAAAAPPPGGEPGSPEADGAAEAPAAGTADPAVAPEEARAGAPPQERDVTAALAARRDALDACVADTPGDGTASRGRRFRLFVVVEPSGRVSDARPYDDAIAATPLGVCLVRLAKEATFPPFDGEPARVEVRVRSDDAE